LKPNKQHPEHASTLYYSPKPQYKLTMNPTVCAHILVFINGLGEYKPKFIMPLKCIEIEVKKMSVELCV